MDDLLIRFCRDVLRGLEDDDQPWFSSDYALCRNLFMWPEYTEVLQLHLSTLFANEYGNIGLPFNRDIQDYLDEKASRSLYQNEMRMEFIHRWAARPLKEEFAGWGVWAYDQWEQILVRFCKYGTLGP